MIALTTERTNISREDAYRLASLAADFHVRLLYGEWAKLACTG